jgi:NAD+ kinase
VVGIACGSLGALTAVTADRIEHALDRISRREYEERRLPALVAEHDGENLSALNDLVLVRAGAGQVMFELKVDGERFIRLAGDGLLAATPLGSSAYTLAAGGPMLAGGAGGLVLTPLAPHGGVCPPLVTGPETEVDVISRPATAVRAWSWTARCTRSSASARRPRSRSGSTLSSPRSSRSARRSLRSPACGGGGS